MKTLLIALAAATALAGVTVGPASAQPGYYPHREYRPDYHREYHRGYHRYAPPPHRVCFWRYGHRVCRWVR